MGIFGALSTSVAGMRAQSFALENISGNIANSQTTAFKRIDTSFLDLIPETGTSRQLAGSVTAMSRSTNSVQGDVQAAQVATFMAINGDGFFSVQKPGGFSDNAPIFDGVDRYTRRGDFQLDKQGFLVNGAGYYLMGIPVDPTTGNLVGSTPQVLQFQSDFLPAQQTTKVDYRANLASYPLTTAHDTAVLGSELLRPASFSTGHNPLSVGTPAPAYTDATVTGDAEASKLVAPTAITAATLLAGAAGTNSITTDFVDADVLTVNGLAINFHTGGGHSGSATAGTLDLDLATATVGDITSAIQAITGVAPTISATGAITLHTGTIADLTITSTNAGALDALGFSAPVSQARGGGGTAGAGQVIGNDLQAFLDEFDRRRRRDSVRYRRLAGEPAVPLGQDRLDLARRRSLRHLEPVLSGRFGSDRRGGRLAEREHGLQLRSERTDGSAGGRRQFDRADSERRDARRRRAQLRRRRPDAIR